MLREAAACAYGGEGLPSGREPGGFDRTREELEELLSDAKGPQELQKQRNHSVRREKKKDYKPLSEKFSIGDSVMIFPDKKIGIVCEPVNERGVLRIQLRDKKIYINHKRVKLHVAAQELYPEDYDFSIVFDTVEQRKTRHKMERKYVEGMLEVEQ